MIVGWLVSLVPSIVFALRQLATNPNLSAYYTTFLYSLVLPVVSFVIFMAWKRRKTGVAHVSESLLLTMIVTSAVSMASAIGRLTLNWFQVVFTGSLDWWYFEMAVCLISSAVMFGVLWGSKRRQLW